MLDRAAIRAACTMHLITIDTLSSTRYVHATSLRDQCHRWATPEELDAYVAHVTSATYRSKIEIAVLGGRLLGAWLDTLLIGTAGWSPMPDVAATARLRWCHVLPLFGHLGIGSQLLAEVEAAAFATGTRTCVVRAPPNATSFFEHNGYEVTGHGTRTVPPGINLPVTFLRRTLTPPIAD